MSTPSPPSTNNIEVRPFEGDAQRLAEFSQKVWIGSYQGHMTVPLWDAAYFDWQLLSPRPEGRDFLHAAYDGDRLVGTLLGELFPFRVGDRTANGTIGSWLSVDPEYRRRGIGSKLFAELKRQHHKHDAPFQIGYAYTGAKIAIGPKFWKQFPANAVPLFRVGLWARVIDHRTVAASDVHRIDRWGTRLLSAFQGKPRPPVDREGIREYRPSDLEDCLQLVSEVEGGADMSIHWLRERLQRQLDYQGVPRTLVCQSDGGIRGLVNYHPLAFLGRDKFAAGVIDLLAVGALNQQQRKKLLRVALHQMHEEGLHVALLLRQPLAAARALLACGFIPRPPDHYLLCVRVDPEFSVDSVRSAHVLWR